MFENVRAAPAAVIAFGSSFVMSLHILRSPSLRAVRRCTFGSRAAFARVLSCLLVAATATPAFAQVSLTALDAPYRQNFDSLPASGTANPWADNSTLAGWYNVRSGGTTTTIVADAGINNAGNLYSYGAAGSSDRALGSINSNATGEIYAGLRLRNATGATITSLDVAYTGEQWRNGGNTALQPLLFSYLVGRPLVTGSLAEFQAAGVAVPALDFTSPVATASAGALDGNAAANRSVKTVTISGLNIPNGSEVMLRWLDHNESGNDHGLAIDDLAVTPHGTGAGGPTLSIDDVTHDEGNAGTTTFRFTVQLSQPAAGDVSFDIATADGSATAPSDYAARALSAQVIPAGSTSYSFDVPVNGDTVSEPDETFFVNLSNASGAAIARAQGVGTILNDDMSITKIHAVQGSGATTPMPGATVTVEGIVTANFLGSSRLSGFFVQEADADADNDPNTSEGLFVYCAPCVAGAVAEGQRVRVTGTVNEFFNMTQITAASAAAVAVTGAGNHLAEVTPVQVTLPISGDVDAFYEAREAMLVTYTDPLTVSEYFQLPRYGQIELVQGARSRQFTEDNAPSVAGYVAHLDALARRRVILDDDNNVQNSVLTQPDGQQALYYPQQNGGFSVGTQGVDFFRGGDTVHGLTGVLHWSFAGLSGTDAWRVRPTTAHPAVFTPSNPRPATPPDVGGSIRAVGMNLLNYFTTIDTTPSSSSGPCGPSHTMDCRGADSEAELARQRERASIVVCSLNPDVAGFMELENTTPTDTINDLLGAVNARCGGAHPYAFVNTGGTLGSDAIRVILVYRQGVLTPFGAALTDLNAIHNRPPTAQTFDVSDAANPAFGQRFTVVANHFKSKGSCPVSGGDTDQNDGQACWSATRTAQASRLLSWINGTVIPAAGDPDVLLLGDFNAYASETPVTTLKAGGYLDLETEFHGTDAYSYLFDGELGHLDYAFASTSLAAQVTGADAWHINADEVPVFDYNDEIKDVGEPTQDEKPDGSALTPPRTLWEPGTPYRASDHDPIVVGLFGSTDLAIGMTDAPDPVTAGSHLVYTVNVANNGPADASAAVWSDTLPAGTTFVSLASASGWTCTTPAVGAGGTVNCSKATFAVGSATFTLTVAVASSVAPGSVLTNTATIASSTGDSNVANNSATTTTTVAGMPQGHLGITPASVAFGNQAVGTTSAVQTVTLSNGGSASLNVTALTAPNAPFARAGGSCATTLPITLAAGASCTLGYTFAPSATGAATQTLTVTANAPGSGTIALSGTGVAVQADVAVTITNHREFVQIGDTLDYVIVVSNAGPAAATALVADTLPPALSDGSWTCVPSGAASCASGSGNVLSDQATLPVGSSVTYVYSATVLANAAADRIQNSASASVQGGTVDPNPANNIASDAVVVVVFRDGFESDGATLALDGRNEAGFVSAQLAIDPLLLEGLGIAPVSLARGETADGRTAFSLDLARFNAQYVMRLTMRDVQGRSERGAWQSVDLAREALDLAWQSAVAGHADGYLRLIAGPASLQSVDRADSGRLVRLHVASGNGAPWLSLLAD